MEVHHHSHAAGPADHRGGKKWTHYFWEFFMLFLAVTLGFFVENQREHFIEHKRAKVYAKTMLADLQKDTTELRYVIFRGMYASNYLDTFLHLISENEFKNIPTGKLYWYGLWGGYLRGFAPNDATFQQMKNSGSLRYFSNTILEQKVRDYDQLLRSIYMLIQIDQPIFIETRKARAKIFDFRYNNDANQLVQRAIYGQLNQQAIDSFINTNPPLLTYDKTTFNEYAEWCRSRNLKQQQLNAEQAFQLARDLIISLKEAFHLH